MRQFALAVALSILALPAAADYRPVTDQSEFLSLISGKRLTMRIYGLELIVAPSGQIAGEALGYPVTGAWDWQNGFFCREMDWGGDEIPYNCQLVEVHGDLLRFTVDQGAGRSAAFRLR